MTEGSCVALFRTPYRLVHCAIDLARNNDIRTCYLIRIGAQSRRHRAAGQQCVWCRRGDEGKNGQMRHAPRKKRSNDLCTWIVYVCTYTEGVVAGPDAICGQGCRREGGTLAGLGLCGLAGWRALGWGDDESDRAECFLEASGFQRQWNKQRARGLITEMITTATRAGGGRRGQ